MKSEKTNLKDAILDKLLPLIYVLILVLLFWGVEHTSCVTYPHYGRAGRGFDCSYAFAYVVPDWLHVVLKWDMFLGKVLLASLLIDCFLSKYTKTDGRIVGTLFILFLVINLILAFIIEYLNGWLIFD